MCVRVCVQSCPTLCDPMDCSSPGSSVHEISQASILEWVVISFSRGISPTQGSHSSLLCFLHWQADSLHCATWESHIHIYTYIYIDTCASNSKESACNAGDPGLIPGLGRSPGEGNGYPLQYSCLENSMDRRATVHGVSKNPTQLSH